MADCAKKLKAVVKSNVLKAEACPSGDQFLAIVSKNNELKAIGKDDSLLATVDRSKTIDAAVRGDVIDARIGRC